MKTLKYLLFLVLIAIIAFAIYIAVQPSSFEVSRERTINAPASVLYNNVIDYKNWESWSPWKEKEPNLKITYPEQTKGIDGSYSWEGKDGLGRMKTLSAVVNKSIVQELQFDDYDPSKVIWDFEPTEDNKTKVTWKMKSENVPFVFKGFAAVSGGFDNMIGPDFERGLEKLDSLVIEDMKKYDIKIDGVVQHGGGFYIYNTASTRMDEFESKVKEMMPKVGSYAAKNNITMAGAPFILYHKWDEANNATMFSCCIPTTARVITTESDIVSGQMEPFKAVKVTLTGDYSNLKEAWEKGMKYVTDNNLEFTESGPMIEAYVTDPMTDPNPANWVTEIYMAVK